MSREDPQLKIRLPVDLKVKIEAAAQRANRTLNAEVVSRLAGSFEGERARPDTERVLRLQVDIAAQRQQQVMLKTEEYQTHVDLERVARALESVDGRDERNAVEGNLAKLRERARELSAESEAIRERIVRLERELMSALTVRP